MHHTRSVALTVFASALMVALAPSRDAASQTTEPRVVEVVVRRFAFEPTTIEAVEGERLRVLVRSADGPHGFEIKRFKVSKEVPRGSEPVTIEFTASEVGHLPDPVFAFCGDGHEDMKGALGHRRAVARR
jgi:heme/copper-type cytochrome/quinol oxidase subunit 2